MGALIRHESLTKTEKGGMRRPLSGKDGRNQCPAACDGLAPHTYMQANRNSHTTSTKCQYQAANSNPICCFDVNWPARARIRHTVRKIEPMMTWNPWKPVAMKNVAP